jgi:hypothetical protein
MRMSVRPSHQLSATATPEVSLLLRAHSEQHWLSREVVPVVRQIATCEGSSGATRKGSSEVEARLELEAQCELEALPEEQLPAALAYLEVVWSEAVRRAGDTDKALTCLDLTLPAAESPECLALAARARRYRAAVLVLREALARRVAALLSEFLQPVGESL